MLCTREKSEGMHGGVDAILEIPQGKLQGLKDKSCLGQSFYSFLRIPYAKPPIGELRFKVFYLFIFILFFYCLGHFDDLLFSLASLTLSRTEQPPQPASGWTGIRDATTEGTVCPSTDFSRTQYIDNCDEDSLFVNVYCKHNPNKTGDKKLPVIVWIHGGGFEFGSGNKSSCGPDYFMNHDVILVTFNYRLGVLGFLSLQTVNCPGNYGLKDQQLAIRWVKNNISYFGGDSDNITIAGISAGGASVQYQTLSPGSQGLFKRAIAQSGSSLNRWGYSRHPRENAFLLGKRLGCDTKDEKVLLEFLRKVPAKDLVLKGQRIIDEVEGEYLGEHFLNFTFVPTTEPEHEGAFLSKHPWTMLKEGKYMDVPYITGICSKEMILGVRSEKDFPQFTKDEEFQAFIPRDIQWPKNSERSLNLAKRIREFYFKNGITLDSYIDILSDSFFNFGVYKTVACRTSQKHIKSPTHLYRFAYEGGQMFIKQMMGLANIKGASHGEDTGYFFRTEFSVLEKMIPGSPDYNVMMKMTKLWVDFATNGVLALDEPKLSWKATTHDDLDYLDVGDKFEMKKKLLKERMEFWNEAYTSYYEN